MKHFESTASRIRAVARLVRLGGIALCIGAFVWLFWVTLSPARSTGPVDFELPQSVSVRTRPDALDVLASRSIRQELRPHPQAVVSVQKPVQVLPPDVEVIATIVNPGQTPSAFVRSKSARRMVTVRPGAQIDGATVKSISDGQVVLERQGQEFPISVGRKGS